MSEIQVVEPTALQAMQRAEIDSTIATAKAYPRDIKEALERVEQMATMTEAIAAECHYSLPRKDKDGKPIPINGPSIRFAEILASQWGNLRIASRITDVGAREVVAQGVCLDLETNVAYDVENRKSIVSRNGRRYSDDLIVTNANAAAAIAQRNAIMKAVPKPLWNPIYEATLRRIGGDRTRLTERWHKAVAWFKARGVPEEKLKAAIGITKPADVTQEHIVQLVGWTNAIEQDPSAVDEIFGIEPERKEKPRPKRRPPKEVTAKAAEKEPESDEDVERKAALLGELRDATLEFDENKMAEVREAAGIGVGIVNESCTLEQLEAAIRKASEIAQGERE